MAPNWKPLKHILWGEWTDKWEFIHTVEYYIARRRNELLLYGITWVNVTKEASYKECVWYSSIYIKFKTDDFNFFLPLRVI